MAGSRDAAQLRAALSRYREQKRYGEERSAESRLPSLPKLAEGLPLVPVVVRPEHRDVPPMRLELALADGTPMQVSGLAGRDLAEAIETLRRTRRPPARWPCI